MPIPTHPAAVKPSQAETKRIGAAPPVYRPLQTASGQTVLQQKPKLIGPPVYRPQQAASSAQPKSCGAPPVFRPPASPGGRAPLPFRPGGSTPPASRPLLPAQAGRSPAIQAKFPRPTNAGRTQLRWDKAKVKLNHRPNDWNDCVERANDIDQLEAFVEEVLTSSERRRKQEEEQAKAASKASHEEKQKEQQRLAAIERERKEAEAEALRKQREEAEAERIRRIEAAQEPKGRRRLEAVARLLESPDNVCVAVVEVGGRYYAATNQGGLAPLQFDLGTLFVSNLGGMTGKFERERARDAAKVSASLGTGELSIDPGAVVQVGAALSNAVHAEMKLLNALYTQGVTGDVDLYISKLCCANCRIAIDEWNGSANQPKIRTPGTHSDYFPGWEFPPCIVGRLRKRIRARILGQESDVDTTDMRGRSRVREETRAQRERSYSPEPRDARVGEFARS